MSSVGTDPTHTNPQVCGRLREAHVHYRVTNHERKKRNLRGSLVDRGANGGILGKDARVIRTHTREVDVTGIDNHELNALKIVDAAAKVMSQAFSI